MIRTLPQELEQAEVLRYLGATGKPMPNSVQALLQKAKEELWQAASPRAATKLLPLEQIKPLLQGKDILLHLQGCDSGVLLGVTLGLGVDTLLRRALAMDMAYAVVLDAAASVLVEQIADELEQQIRQSLSQQNRFMTGRFSPGYGDWPISVQPQFVQYLDAFKQAGLCTTSSCLLTPSKSVTALCGVANHPVKGRQAGCTTCALRDTCTKRKEGKCCAQENF